MKPYWKVTLWYLAFGVVWIFLSDRLIERLVDNIQLLTSLQTTKGWLYVCVSGMFIFYLTKRAFDAQLAQEKEKLSIFRKTIGRAHHILLNYLNQMQLVTMEAERCDAFDKEIIHLSKDISQEAAAELVKLNDIESLTSDRTESAGDRDLQIAR